MLLFYDNLNLLLRCLSVFFWVINDNVTDIQLAIDHIGNIMGSCFWL